MRSDRQARLAKRVGAPIPAPHARVIDHAAPAAHRVLPLPPVRCPRGSQHCVRKNVAPASVTTSRRVERCSNRVLRLSSRTDTAREMLPTVVSRWFATAVKLPISTTFTNTDMVCTLSISHPRFEFFVESLRFGPRESVIIGSAPVSCSQRAASCRFFCILSFIFHFGGGFSLQRQDSFLPGHLSCRLLHA